MKHTSLNVAMLALAASLALAGCKKNENTNPQPMPAPTTPAPAPAPAPAPMPAASVAVEGVSVGKMAAADKSVAPMATFGVRDPIIVSVRTNGTANAVPVAAKLTFHDGQVAGEQNVSLNTSGPDTTNITFTNANAWPAGKYTVDVMVDGRPAGISQQIEVR
jgi:hypothetical protein